MRLRGFLLMVDINEAGRFDDLLRGIHKGSAKQNHNDNHKQQCGGDHQALLFSLLGRSFSLGVLRGNIGTLHQNIIISEGVGTTLQNSVGHLGVDDVLSLNCFSAGTDIIDIAVNFDGTGMARLTVAIIEQLSVFFL